MIKILKAKAHPDRIIEVEYNDGIKGSFVFNDFFNYEGIMSPLEDITSAAGLDVRITLEAA